MDSSSLSTGNFELQNESLRLICNAFEQRILNGENAQIEEFLQGTELNQQTTLLSRLILIELRHRWVRGEAPSLEEYLARFPEQTDTIQGLIPEIERMARRFSLALIETVVKPETIKKLGHFNIRNELGRGSFGTVWLAWDTKLRRDVAIKSITHYNDPERDAPMTLHEAQAAARLNHPNIVRILDVEEIEGKLYLISEYVEGVNLGSELSNGQIDYKKSAYICRRIAESLQHAHDAGVVHRDIKPGNIIIDSSGVPRLTDFGVAKYTDAERTLTNEDGKIVGSVRYMSPEQSRGGTVDGRSDIYSLGIVLYELLTGVPPFKGTLKEVLFSHQFRDPRAPRSISKKISKDLETICLKAMAKNPVDRYATAGDMAADLSAYSTGTPILAKPPGHLRRIWLRVKRRPAATASYIVQAIVVMAAFGTAAWALADVTPHAFGKWDVKIDTYPTGGRILAIPIDPITEASDGTRPTVSSSDGAPISVWLDPGWYRVIAQKEGRASAEAIRYVPPIGEAQGIFNPQSFLCVLPVQGMTDAIKWRAIILPDPTIVNDMILIPGRETVQDSALAAWDMKSFYLAVEEYRIKDYMQIRKGVPHQMKDRGEDAPFICSQIDARHWAEESGARLPTLNEIQYAIVYLQYYVTTPRGKDSVHHQRLLASLLDEIPEWTNTLDLHQIMKLERGIYEAMKFTGDGHGIEISTLRSTTNPSRENVSFRLARSERIGDSKEQGALH